VRPDRRGMGRRVAHGGAQLTLGEDFIAGPMGMQTPESPN
jgi:hypothetical protein